MNYNITKACMLAISITLTICICSKDSIEALHCNGVDTFLSRAMKETPLLYFLSMLLLHGLTECAMFHILIRGLDPFYSNNGILQTSHWQFELFHCILEFSTACINFKHVGRLGSTAFLRLTFPSVRIVCKVVKDWNWNQTWNTTWVN